MTQRRRPTPVPASRVPLPRPVTAAFTLIELSIVLVIIGLIVGGVLTGRELIKAAEMRATISQIETFNTAVNTFYGKYGYLPGNIPPTIASQFGLFTLTGTKAGTVGYGSGNGQISFFDSSGGLEGCALYADSMEGSINAGEGFVFWRHLSDAKLIEGSFSSTLNAVEAVSISPATYGLNFPQAKLGNNNFIAACAFLNGAALQGINGSNFFQVLGEANGFASTALTPLDAYRIDTKLDDGLPNTGRVMVATSDTDGQGGSSYSESWAATPTATTCLTGGTSATDRNAQYNFSVTPDAPSCYGVMFQFQ
jgi:prepilin-type N-terminal cleavage/methylation domain-containing protein